MAAKRIGRCDAWLHQPPATRDIRLLASHRPTNARAQDFFALNDAFGDLPWQVLCVARIRISSQTAMDGRGGMRVRGGARIRLEGILVAPRPSLCFVQESSRHHAVIDNDDRDLVQIVVQHQTASVQRSSTLSACRSLMPPFTITGSSVGVMSIACAPARNVFLCPPHRPRIVCSRHQSGNRNDNDDSERNRTHYFVSTVISRSSGFSKNRISPRNGLPARPYWNAIADRAALRRRVPVSDRSSRRHSWPLTAKRMRLPIARISILFQPYVVRPFSRRPSSL